ncbi:uncharacterized protein [Aegilops tauschii subsp. strangulata]|uniref:uncharacterized protein isoform X2 n=1 Tax=Aegilops tauschii subsp. strangulata TaxID=200361 RepID=UPI003CC87999
MMVSEDQSSATPGTCSTSRSTMASRRWHDEQTLEQLATQTTKNTFKGVPPTWYINKKFSNQYKAMNGGTPGGIRYFGELEDHCYWGNKVKLYECHVDTLFYVLV